MNWQTFCSANIENRFVPTNDKVLIKNSFTLVNFQPAPAENLAPITNITCQSNNVDAEQYFNGYIPFSLKIDMKKIIIFNAESGTWWRY